MGSLIPWSPDGLSTVPDAVVAADPQRRESPSLRRRFGPWPEPHRLFSGDMYSFLAKEKAPLAKGGFLVPFLGAGNQPNFLA